MPAPTTTRWRLLRAGIFAVVAGQLAALGHVLGGGRLPDLAVLITVTVFLGGAISGLADRRRTGPQIFGMLVLAQFAFHTVFLLTTGHTAHADLPVGGLSVLGAGPMLAFHLIAALATSWLLTGGESALFRLCAALRRVLLPARRVPPVSLAPAWTAMVTGGAGAVRLWAGELSLISRRGPPGAP